MTRKGMRGGWAPWKELRRLRAARAANIVHGMCETAEYHAWESAKQRCTNPSNPAYPNYGGRGIEMRLSFPEFLQHIGPRPGGGYLLDRIDNDGNYDFGNIRWATPRESIHNRRDNRRVSRACKVCGVIELRRSDAVICIPCAKREYNRRMKQRSA